MEDRVKEDEGAIFSPSKKPLIIVYYSTDGTHSIYHETDGANYFSRDFLYNVREKTREKVKNEGITTYPQKVIVYVELFLDEVADFTS
jgi:hypothetical protein